MKSRILIKGTKMDIEIFQEDNSTKNRKIAKFDKSLATLTTSAPLSLAESKLVFNIIAQIDTDDTDFKEYTINATQLHDEIKNELNAEARKKTKLKGKVITSKDIAKTKSAQLKIFCKNMMSKGLELPVENELDFKLRPWFTTFDYNSEEDTIKCKFLPELKPYLLDFKNNHFKKIHSTNLFRFKSKYTHRFYLLLKTNHLHDTYISIDTYKTIIPIEWIRKWLGLDKIEYKRYNDFKRRIIEKVQQDLDNHAEVSFEYEEVKIKRKVTYLKFKVKYKDNQLPNEKEIDLTPTKFSDYYEEVDIVPKHMTIDDFMLETNRCLLIDEEEYELQMVIMNENKYVLVTNKGALKQTHKSRKKLLTDLIRFNSSYRMKYKL
jgi:plasmid replication initiation protein